MQNVTIYAIRHKEADRCYIGSSISLRERFAHHRSHLKLGKHHCLPLQEAWSEFGAAAFEFLILEQCVCQTHADRRALELKWICAKGFYNLMMPDEGVCFFEMAASSRAKVSVTNRKKIETDPSYREFLAKRGDALRKYIQSPEGRAMMSVSTTARWKDPLLSAALRKGLTNRWAAPDARKKFSEKMTPILADPKRAKAHSKKLETIWSDPEASEAYRAARAKQWNDPKRRRIQSEKLKAAWAKRKAAAAD